MKHTLTAKMHCSARIRERLNRPVISRDVNKMRLALLRNNPDCFMQEGVYDDAIIGIVRYQNIYTRAVLDRNLGVVVTVGVDLPQHRARR